MLGWASLYVEHRVNSTPVVQGECLTLLTGKSIGVLGGLVGSGRFSMLDSHLISLKQVFSSPLLFGMRL